MPLTILVSHFQPRMNEMSSLQLVHVALTPTSVKS